MPTRASAGGRDEAAPIQIRAQFLRERGACAPQGPSSGFAITLDDEAESKSECAPRRRASWQQKDVERALRAAREAGLTAYRVEIAPDGTISILVGDPGEEKPVPAAA